MKNTVDLLNLAIPDDVFVVRRPCVVFCILPRILQSAAREGSPGRKIDHGSSEALSSAWP